MLHDLTEAELHVIDGGQVECWGIAIVFGSESICFGVSH